MKFLSKFIFILLTNLLCININANIMSETNLPKIEFLSLSKFNNKVLFSHINKTDKILMHFELPKQGRAYVSRNKAGVTNIIEELFLKGTKDKDAKKIGEILILANSEITLNYGQDHLFLSVSMHKDQFSKILDLLEELINKTEITENNFEVSKNKIKAFVMHDKGNPKAIANEEIYKFSLEGHPYANFPTEQTLNNIKINDAKKRFKKINFYEAKISVVGNIEKDLLKTSLDNFLSKVNTNPNLKPKELINAQFKGSNEIKKIKFDTIQSVIKFTQQINFNKNKLLEYQLLSSILNQPFTGVLFKKFRLDLGYVYNIRANLDLLEKINLFNVSYSTDNKNIKDAIEQLKFLLSDFDNILTEDKLDTAKKNLIHKKYRDLDELSLLLAELKYINHYDLPEFFLADFSNNIQKINLENLKQTVQEMFNQTEYAFLVVGKK